MAGVVLLSGGLDSTVALALFLENNSLELALTFDYGQKASEQEIKAAGRIAKHYGLWHEVVELPFLQEQTLSALVNQEAELPALTIGELDDAQGKAGLSAQSVWVPNRNGLFLNVAAVYAENLAQPAYVVAGFNREEAATFSDNSSEFMTAVNQSLHYSTRQNITVVSPTVGLNKDEIVREGLRLKVPFDCLWSCYTGQEQACGVCESCLRLKRALLHNNQAELAKSMFRN